MSTRAIWEMLNIHPRAHAQYFPYSPAGRHALTDLQPDNFHGTKVFMVTVKIAQGASFGEQKMV